ncbi:hypothetical protein [Intestinimonas timonensis]|uniref:hypothetical protein n=1 Tax=Intestinimonas timonensis TaxID=1689270 RepID=UPI00102FE007|nr:hypothetical protein [Intestinimonas timonensis]
MSEILLNGMPFDDYLEKYEIFEKTTKFMMEYLKNWYDDDPKNFQRAMRADYRTVAETYQFKQKIAAFEKNYMYDAPLLCIAFSMDINDEEDDYVAIYTAIFDLNGNCIDDLMS